MKERREGPGSDRGAKVSGRAGKSNAQTEQLRKISKKLGNAQVQNLIGRNDKSRDALYQFIVQRLQKIRAVQGREKEAMGKQRVWFDEVAHKKSGFGLPDPTRWRQAAKHYRLAALSVARGNLGQAVAHLDRAMEAEKQAFQNLPKQVALDHTETSVVERPGEAANVHAGEGCNPREVTEALHLADDIERESDKAKPASLRKLHRPWWGSEVEEAEDDKQKPDGKKGAKAAAEAGKAKGEAKEAGEKQGEEHAAAEKEPEEEKEEEKEEEREHVQERRPQKAGTANAEALGTRTVETAPVAQVPAARVKQVHAAVKRSKKP